MKKMAQTRLHARNKLCVGILTVLLLAAALLFGGVGASTTEAHAATNNEVIQRVSGTEFKIMHNTTTNGSLFYMSKTPLTDYERQNGHMELWQHPMSVDISWYSDAGANATTLIDVTTLGDSSCGFVFEYDVEYYIYLLDRQNGYSDIITPMQITFRDCPIVPLPEDPVQEGYHFVGWYYDANFLTPYAGELIYEDTELYARFEIDTFTVTYDSTGGSPVESVIVDWNTSAPTPETTREGYNFVGWFDESGEEYDDAAITADTVLTAHWEIKVFTVTFYTGQNVYKTVEVVWGTTLVEAMETANIVTFAAYDAEGVKVSKTASVITDNAEVFVRELPKTEKIGEYLGTHPWIMYTVCALIGALLLISVVSSIVAAKRK